MTLNASLSDPQNASLTARSLSIETLLTRRVLETAYILYITASIFWIAGNHLRNPNGWTPGDWLINFEGGFVRRGLPGQLILLGSRSLHLSPIAVATLLPLVFYALISFCVWTLYRQSTGQLWTIAALLSPATLAFPVLDSVGGFRKETIDLAGLGLLLVLLQRRSARDLHLIAYLTAVCTLVILSHEALVPYLLYYVAAMLLAVRDIKHVAKILLLPAITSAIAFVAVLRHQGNQTLEQSICHSLGAVPPIVCSGAIAYLANGTDVAHQDVLRNMHAYHYLFYFPIVAALGLLPLAAGIVSLYRHHRLRSGLILVSLVTLAAFAASSPLFIYAMDWGRWIHIHLFSLFLLLTFMDAESQAGIHLALPVRPSLPTRTRRRISIVGLILYATCWNIPHYGNFPKKGYLNVPLHLLKQDLKL